MGVFSSIERRGVHLLIVLEISLTRVYIGTTRDKGPGFRVKVAGTKSLFVTRPSTGILRASDRPWSDQHRHFMASNTRGIFKWLTHFVSLSVTLTHSL
jgi:hypothetical protein